MKTKSNSNAGSGCSSHDLLASLVADEEAKLQAWLATYNKWDVGKKRSKSQGLWRRYKNAEKRRIAAEANARCGGTAAQDSQSEANDGRYPPLPRTTCSVSSFLGSVTAFDGPKLWENGSSENPEAVTIFNSEPTPATSSSEDPQ